jgi:hypothetical protein
MHHAFHRLVDGSVAARHHNQVGAASNVFPYNGTRRAWTRSRGNRYGMAVFLQDLYGAAQKCASATPEFAGSWII